MLSRTKATGKGFAFWWGWLSFAHFSFLLRILPGVNACIRDVQEFVVAWTRIWLLCLTPTLRLLLLSPNLPFRCIPSGFPPSSYLT
jgi:hypothetical protein